MKTKRRLTQNKFLLNISTGLFSSVILLACATPAQAQEPVPVVKPNYNLAERYSSQYLRQFVYSSSVTPNWIGKTDEFWYLYRTSAGTKYYRVDPKHATKEDLFDHAKLASLLSEMIRKPLDAVSLPLSRVEIEKDGSAIKFVVDKFQYQYGLNDEKLVKLGKAPPAPVSSRFGRPTVTEKKEDEKKEEDKKDVKEEVDKQETETKKKEQNEKQEKQNTSDQKDDEQDSNNKHKSDQSKEKETLNTESSKQKKKSSKQKNNKDVDGGVKENESEKQDKNEDNNGEKNEKVDDDKTVKSGDKQKESSAEKKESDKEQTDHRAFSPDRTAYVYAKGHDLYYVEIPEGYKYESPKSRKSDDDKASTDKDKTEDNEDGDAQKSNRDNKNGDSDEQVDLKTDQSENKNTETSESETNRKKNGRQKKKSNEKRRSRKNKVQSKKIDNGQTDADDQVSGNQNKDEKQDGDDKVNEKQDDSKKDENKKDSDNEVGDQKKQGKSKTENSKEEDDKAKDGDDEDDEKEKELPIPEIGPELDATAIRLTEDGEEKFSFARSSRFRGGSRGGTKSKEELEKAKTAKTKPSVSWSKDSKAFHVSRRDSRKVKQLFVINSLSTPRPTLEQYSYSMPGEENVSISHYYYMTRDAKKLVEVEKKWTNETFRDTHWKKDGHQLRFIRSDRLLRNIELCELDLDSGKVTCLIEEGFDAANLALQSPRYLKDTDEMLWFSEKSGWAHFYLYDLDGNLKNAVTSGEFRASRIVDIDEKNRLVYFTGNAREPGENIYHNHLYCIRLDGTGLTLLDPGDANHRSTLSPTKKYLVDNCSRVDMAPISVLRDAQGNEIMKLEESDMSRLKEVGWKMPDTFVVKAADGVTNLYGNIWKPFDFSPKKKYPLIAHVYPGPQMEGTSHTFSATAGNQQLAQLGFVVIQVGHRGGTPQRSKAYHSYGYFNLRDYGLADKKAAIEQLGQRFPWVDVERVGIYGHSGGGFMTAAALLREPYNDFFKVGVSTAGNHDNNIYNSSWSERYHGLKEVPVTAKKSSSTTNKDSSEKTEVTRSTRSGAPDIDGVYTAYNTEESDFFYEHEGSLNSDGDFDLMANHDLYDGPRAFQTQDTDEKTKQETENKKERDSKRVRVRKDGNKKTDAVTTTDDVTKEKSDSKTDDKKTDNSDANEDEEKKTRFEIKVPTNAELAKNLKGHLFLIHGESDNNVHPANTLRLVDALIKAEKRFDMLYLPATRHGFGSYQPYVTQRMYEYFAEHLLDDYQSEADMGDRN